MMPEDAKGTENPKLEQLQGQRKGNETYYTIKNEREAIHKHPQQNDPRNGSAGKTSMHRGYKPTTTKKLPLTRQQPRSRASGHT